MNDMKSRPEPRKPLSRKGDPLLRAPLRLWLRRRGYGFIGDPEGDVFVHARWIEDPDARKIGNPAYDLDLVSIEDGEGRTPTEFLYEKRAEWNADKGRHEFVATTVRLIEHPGFRSV